MKYPLMSSTTLRVLGTKTLTGPLEFPAGMSMALALMRPSSEFKVETVGWPSPVGQMVRYDNVVIGTAVTLSEYATASEGMLHGLPLCDSGNERAVLAGIAGPPNVPLGLRVSTMRHGGKVTNCKAWATGFTI